MPISDYAILIDPTGSTIGALPAGTVRANTTGESQKIVIGKASSMNKPFCNGIEGLQFFALPADPNFSEQFVIIGRNGSVPTYWGCTDTAALVVQCIAFNGGSNEFQIGGSPPPYFLDEGGNELTNCKLFLDNNGYALSNSADAVFLESYFPV
jgi:hypothetical protein